MISPIRYVPFALNTQKMRLHGVFWCILEQKTCQLQMSFSPPPRWGS